MGKIIIGVVMVAAMLTVAVPKTEAPRDEADPPQIIEKSQEEIRTEKIKEYLEKKESPLADHAETMEGQKHWRLLIAISAIESQFCKRKISFNCWGLGGDSNYQKYAGYDEAIIAANDLIEKFQKRGRWMTVDSMLGSYVVPGSPNWTRTVKGTLAELKEIE